MNRHQEIALAFHCRLACETVHQRFHYLVPEASVVLTIDSGWA